MKILLFGGSGQLGFELHKRATDLDFEIVSPVTSEVNITEKDQVQFLINRVKPDVVMNCAAYTAVDAAETEQEQAYKINRDGPRFVAEACKGGRARMIQLSTDYVFDGELGRPLTEQDPTNPTSVYGKSKLEGEHAVTNTLGDRALIVRTSSLHGQRGVNFVHTMLKLFKEREVVKVVNDQIMSPTWAGWLAEALLDLCRIDTHGVLHASCAGAISWYDFANKILELSRSKLKDAPIRAIEPMRADELQRAARRPRYSAFDTAALAAVLGRKPISWIDGLKGHLTDIGAM